MKKLLLALSLLSMGGCAAVDAMLMSKFDGSEYHLITQIRVDASEYANGCSNPILGPSNAIAMAHETELFEKYSEQIPHNDDGYDAAKKLNEIAQGLKSRYGESTPVPPIFCKLKYSSIESSAKVLQHVIGSRPR